jgi:hypothetical protein
MSPVSLIVYVHRVSVEETGGKTARADHQFKSQRTESLGSPFREENILLAEEAMV